MDGSCGPRTARRAHNKESSKDKNLNLVDVYDIAADIGKVRELRANNANKSCLNFLINFAAICRSLSN